MALTLDNTGSIRRPFGSQFKMATSCKGTTACLRTSSPRPAASRTSAAATQMARRPRPATEIQCLCNPAIPISPQSTREGAPAHSQTVSTDHRQGGQPGHCDFGYDHARTWPLGHDPAHRFRYRSRSHRHRQPIHAFDDGQPPLNGLRHSRADITRRWDVAPGLSQLATPPEQQASRW